MRTFRLAPARDRGAPVPIVFTDDQWARLQAVFPDGVDVVYGGQPLPDVPKRSGTGWSSQSFRGLLKQ